MSKKKTTSKVKKKSAIKTKNKVVKKAVSSKKKAIRKPIVKNLPQKPKSTMTIQKPKPLFSTSASENKENFEVRVTFETIME